MYIKQFEAIQWLKKISRKRSKTYILHNKLFLHYTHTKELSSLSLFELINPSEPARETVIHATSTRVFFQRTRAHQSPGGFVLRQLFFTSPTGFKISLSRKLEIAFDWELSASNGNVNYVKNAILHFSRTGLCWGRYAMKMTKFLRFLRDNRKKVT